MTLKSGFSCLQRHRAAPATHHASMPGTTRSHRVGPAGSVETPSQLPAAAALGRRTISLWSHRGNFNVMNRVMECEMPSMLQFQNFLTRQLQSVLASCLLKKIPTKQNPVLSM